MGEMTFWYYYSYLSSGHSAFQGHRSPHSLTKSQARATVRHVSGLGLLGLYKVQYLLTARCMYATKAAKIGVCGCVYLRCTRNKGTLRFYLNIKRRRTRKKIVFIVYVERHPVLSKKVLGILVYDQSPNK